MPNKITPTDYDPSQVTSHRPEEGLWGNCMQCSLAALLRLPVSGVPDFGKNCPNDTEEETDAMWRAVDEWLTARFRCTLTHFAFTASVADTMAYMAHHNPDVVYLMGIQSPRAKHFVVGCNQEIVFDTHEGKVEDYGPCDGGFVWIDILTPTFPSIPKKTP